MKSGTVACLAAFLATLLLVVTPARAAGPVQVLSQLRMRPGGRSTVARATAALEQLRRRLLDDDSGSELRPARVVRVGNRTVVQFEQWLDGFPVLGAGAAVVEKAGGTITMVTSTLKPMHRGPRRVRLADREQARQLAERAFLDGGRRRRGPARVRTAWLLLRDGPALTRVVTVPGLEPLGDFIYLVIDSPPRLLWAFRRGANVLGYAYPQNPAVGPYEQVELPYLTSSEHLTGDNVTVYNCTGTDQCGTKQQLATPDANGDYLIEPTGANDPKNIDDTFVEVQAYYGINFVHDYFAAVGFNPSPIEVQVNYPMQQPNAMYDGQGHILMGQSGSIDLAVENDVIYHEYGHHVFGEVSSTGMFNMDQYGPVTTGLAVNEATADYYSCSALDDPELGEYFAQQLPEYFPDGYLRDVDNELTCPWGLYGEAHQDGEIWSGFLWDARGLLGQAMADNLYMKVLAAFPQTVTFPAVTQVYLDTAADNLDAATVEQLRALAEQRGITDCERFIELRRQPHRGFAYGKEILGQYGSGLAFVPAELHYFIEIPDNAYHLSLTFTSRPPAADMIILVREDQRIEHSFSWVGGLESTYDFSIPGSQDIDLPSDDPPFRPGHTYYLEVANQGQATGEYTLAGFVLTEDSDGGAADGGDTTDGGTTDGGATDAGGDSTGADGQPTCDEGYGPAWDGEQWVCVPICKDGYEPKLEGDTWVCSPQGSGCGCSAGHPAASGYLLLLVLGLALVRRQRR